jgi:hypothetical protein
MNEASNRLPSECMTGQEEISEALMNAVEVAIRALRPLSELRDTCIGTDATRISLFRITVN